MTSAVDMEAVDMEVGEHGRVEVSGLRRDVKRVTMVSIFGSKEQKREPFPLKFQDGSAEKIIRERNYKTCLYGFVVGKDWHKNCLFSGVG